MTIPPPVYQSPETFILFSLSSNSWSTELFSTSDNIIKISIFNVNQESEMRKVCSHWLGSRSLLSGRNIKFSPGDHFQISSGVHPAACLTGTAGQTPAVSSQSSD
jgi:hypothetical protein